MRQIASLDKHKQARSAGKPYLDLQAPQVRVVLRGPRDGAVARDGLPTGDVIAPIERGLAVLSCFEAGSEWLGNQDIAQRTGIPKATVTRLTQTLTQEGFLHHSVQLRKYCLASAVLGLGFATIDNAEIANIARPLMQKLADDCGVFVTLAGRDGLDIVLVENCHSASNLMTLALSLGTRLPITSSPMGLALLGGLPEVERNYLLDRIRLRYEPEYRMALRQRMADAVDQVAQKGYCVSSGEWGQDLVVASAPVQMAERPPVVVACAGSSKVLTKARLTEFAGPRLADLVQTLQAMPQPGRL
ncbi:MAG: IclR family transcriptional regulator [Haliea sp.]|nr:MAG: IclR family transcriptional regulator [Haliea sp.]